tara:strand:- start:531 stop:1190 length:660 start_codon:yes stop_codon:yes gene_type:complete
MAQRAVSWRSDSNIWSMKNDQYDINTSENINAYSRYIGATQRNFGIEVQQFMKNNENLFRSQVSKTPVNEGNRSSSFGRSMRLSQLYSEGAMKANLRRADIQQTEKIGEGYRKLLTAQSQEMGKRGFGPVPTVQPAKPVGPSFLDQAIAVASTALSFVSSVQSIGASAGAQGAFFGNPKVGAGGYNPSAFGGNNAYNNAFTPSFTAKQAFGTNLSGAYN